MDGQDLAINTSGIPRSRWVRDSRILVIEDEQAIATMLRYNLEGADYNVSVAEDGEAALVMLDEQTPDLILLDWMLPYLSGIEVCRRIRQDKDKRHIPIIMLTAKGDETDVIRGLEAGADDYVTKPFSTGELMARVDAALRRTRISHQANVLEVNDLVLDTEALIASRAGKRLHLAPTEFRLLQTLMQSPGRVFSRDLLLDLVWGMTSDVEARTVDVHVRRLRQAINEEGQPDYIRTVRGVGYSIELEA